MPTCKYLGAGSLFSQSLYNPIYSCDSSACPNMLLLTAAAPSGLIKEEYIHDCIQMDLPPGMLLSDHQASLKLPPPDHYGQPLPPPHLSSEPHRPPPVSRYTNLPVSPKGQISIVEWSLNCYHIVYIYYYYLFNDSGKALKSCVPSSILL